MSQITPPAPEQFPADLVDAAREEYFADMRKTSVIVEGVEIVGLKKTKPAVVQRWTDEILKARTTGEAVDATKAANHHLARLGIFDKPLHMAIDASVLPDGSTSRLGSIIRVDCSELEASTQYKLETSINQRGEAGLSAEGTIRNVFGYADHVSVAADVKSNAAWTASGAIKFPYLPAVFGRTSELQLRAFKSMNSAKKYQRFTLNETGLQATYSPVQNHSIQYGYVDREIGLMPADVSLEMRAMSGEEVKSSISHTYLKDTRDDASVGNRGFAIKCMHEFSGIGGDVGFASTVTNWQHNVPLTKLITLQLAGTAGYTIPLVPLGSSPAPPSQPITAQKSSLSVLDPARLSLVDRFFLGSPMLRGFKTRGAGPRQGEDAVGGNAILATSAHLQLPFPHKTLHDQGLRIHLFTNVGNVGNIPASTLFSSGGSAVLKDFVSNMRASAGAGLALRTPIGRLEANFSQPLSFAQGIDQTKPWQLTLGWAV